MSEATRGDRIIFYRRPAVIVRAAILAAALAHGPWLQAQNPAGAAPAADAKETYAKLCAGCHGADAHGSQQGPGLAGNAAVRRRSVPELAQPDPPGNSSGRHAAVRTAGRHARCPRGLVKSLNMPAADSQVPGDRPAGKEFFFGKGQCASCHMVYGAGEPIGPDLSNVARELTVDQIRQALLQPTAQITPGYALATVHLRDGRTLRGFVRNRTRFRHPVAGLEGRVSPRVARSRLRHPRGEAIPHAPVKATAAEMQDLIAYLSSLSGVHAGPLLPSSRRCARKAESISPEFCIRSRATGSLTTET